MNPLSNPLTSIAARALTAAFLIVMMFSLGLELGGAPRKDKREKRHARWLLVRALVVNLVALPLIAFALVRALRGSGAVATAVLLIAATPGGRFAPQVAKIARADLGLAVEITLFLAKLTGFTAPVTIRWLLGTSGIDAHDLQLMAQLFFLQVLPYVAGRWLRRARPAAADSLRRPLLIAEAIVGVTFFAFLIARGELVRLGSFGATGWASAGAFAFVSLAVGWIAGGHSPDVRRAFAVTAVARNLGLGLVIAVERFDGAVQLALFAIWLMCFVVDLAFAAALRGQRRSLQPA
jgi:BASS family bile acid:Na+ symporter